MNTKAGGQKAAQTNKSRHGDSFYADIGRLGGKTPTTKPKGFAAMDKAKVIAAGRLGGQVSRRRKKGQ